MGGEVCSMFCSYSGASGCGTGHCVELSLCSAAKGINSQRGAESEEGIEIFQDPLCSFQSKTGLIIRELAFLELNLPKNNPIHLSVLMRQS
ncbi:hypothetical protein P8452_55897 [Trifolium repens]|nr:hypothetical protein P8452_55897 [Trifolium repens]